MVRQGNGVVQVGEEVTRVFLLGLTERYEPSKVSRANGEMIDF
jgi:hypothetical protein